MGHIGGGVGGGGGGVANFGRPGGGNNDVECGWAKRLRAVGVHKALRVVGAVRAVGAEGGWAHTGSLEPRAVRWGQWQRSEGGERWGEEGW